MIRPLIFIGLVEIFKRLNAGTNRLLDKNIIVESNITMKNGHKSGNFRLMDSVIRSKTRRWKRNRTIVYPSSHCRNGTRDQVMYKSASLAAEFDCKIRKQNIIIDQCRSMGNFHENVLSDSRSVFHSGIVIIRKAIIMEQILGNTGSLRLPVQPQASGAMMKMISADDHVNGCMHFNAANFCSCQVLFVVDMMNMIILNNREYTTKMPYDSGLSTVMNIAAANHMGTDLLFVPAFVLSLTDAIPLRLCSIFEFDLRPLVVIFRLEIFSK